VSAAGRGSSPAGDRPISRHLPDVFNAMPAVHTPSILSPEEPDFPRATVEVDVADPMEVARWSWLLDVSDEQIRYAVTMVGPNGEAVAEYLEMFCRYTSDTPS
jgi:hypothetical protein